MDDLRTIIGRNFITVVMHPVTDQRLHRKGLPPGWRRRSRSDDPRRPSTTTPRKICSGLQSVVEDAPIVRYVNLLILQSLNERASDIHVEPTADNLRIRYRIDGVLHDMSAAPRAIAAAVVTRLKVMADMNIAEHRIPQDGRISLTLGNRSVDLRMATLPTIYGEKVVMRVLDKSNVVLRLRRPRVRRRHARDLPEASTPSLTGRSSSPDRRGRERRRRSMRPSRRSTRRRRTSSPSRIPVELRIKGINQVQLNQRAGLTFASALRSILRSDPDIVLVGEIRDRETALISVEAALTGHLVLATLHTNDAASTPMRLVEMGLESYLVTSAVSAALAQRLARRLCPNCKEPYEPTEADIARGRLASRGGLLASTPTPKVHRAVGCSSCSNTGYRGRKALLELLVVTEEIERTDHRRRERRRHPQAGNATGHGDTAPGRTAQGTRGRDDPRGNSAGRRVTPARRLEKR